MPDKDRRFSISVTIEDNTKGQEVESGVHEVDGYLLLMFKDGGIIMKGNADFKRVLGPILKDALISKLGG
jgi:hypothetical protein